MFNFSQIVECLYRRSRHRGRDLLPRGRPSKWNHRLGGIPETSATTLEKEVYVASAYGGLPTKSRTERLSPGHPMKTHTIFTIML